MAMEIRPKESNPNIVYADIINMPHHQSTKHPHMSLHDRAAQFMPFAALTGYEDMISEEARTTDTMKDFTETVTDLVSYKLNVISEAIKSGNNPAVEITYFVPDSNKAGGKYVTVKGSVKRIDDVNHKVILKKHITATDTNEVIDFASITDLKSELLDYIDDYM